MVCDEEGNKYKKGEIVYRRRTVVVVTGREGRGSELAKKKYKTMLKTKKMGI